MVEAKGLKDRKTGQEQWKGKESGHAHVEGQWREQKGYGAYFDASSKRTENQWRVRNDVRTQEKEPPKASARSSPRGRYDVRTQEKERLEDREDPGGSTSVHKGWKALTCSLTRRRSSQV